MSLLLESIKIKDGLIFNLDLQVFFACKTQTTSVKYFSPNYETTIVYHNFKIFIIYTAFSSTDFRVNKSL